MQTIQYELTTAIDVREAPVAAGVLLRLLLERSVEYYCTQKGITIKRNDKLADLIRKSALRMEQDGHIDKKKREQLDKMKSSEELISANTLNAWVHNSTYTPTGEDVCNFWDNIRFFLVKCWTV